MRWRTLRHSPIGRPLDRSALREKAFVLLGEEEIELVEQDGVVRQLRVGVDDLEGRFTCQRDELAVAPK